MGKGEKRRTYLPGYAAHKYWVGIERQTHKIVALIYLPVIKTPSLQAIRKQSHRRSFVQELRTTSRKFRDAVNKPVLLLAKYFRSF